jgi:hypothetical protein
MAAALCVKRSKKEERRDYGGESGEREVEKSGMRRLIKRLNRVSLRSS